MYNTLLPHRRSSGQFASLMELYESNYVLVRLLVPALRSMDKSLYVSGPVGAMPLELSEITHCRYTTTFNLTYRFSSPLRREREPDLAIRIYHDARTCEVMSGLIPSARGDLRRVRDLIDGYRLNKFLQRWLSYCLRQGHVFDQSTGSTAAPPPVADRVC